MNPNGTVSVHYDGFQTQFRAVMETILQAAVREATKLFEVSLQTLKAELVQIQENANLTTTGDSSIPDNRRNTTEGNQSILIISKYRDVGVQCEKPILVDQGCSPHPCIGQLHVGDFTSDKLADLCASEDGRRQLALLLIKQEPQETECNNYAPGYFLLKQEGAEPILVRKEPNKETMERVVIPPAFQPITSHHGISREKSPQSVTSSCSHRVDFCANKSNQRVHPARDTAKRSLENTEDSYSQKQTERASAIAPTQASTFSKQHANSTQTPVSMVNVSVPMIELSGAPECTSIHQTKPTAVHLQPNQHSKRSNQTLFYQKDLASNVCHPNTFRSTQLAQPTIPQSQVLVQETHFSNQPVQSHVTHTEKTLSISQSTELLTCFSQLTQQPIFSPQAITSSPVQDQILPSSLIPPQAQVYASSPQMSPSFQFPLVPQHNPSLATQPSYFSKHIPFTPHHHPVTPIQRSISTLSGPSTDTLNQPHHPTLMQSQYSTQLDQFSSSSSSDHFFSPPDNTSGLLESLDTLHLHSPIVITAQDDPEHTSMHHSHPFGKLAPLLTQKEQQAAVSTSSNVVIGREPISHLETPLETADVQLSPYCSASGGTEKSDLSEDDVKQTCSTSKPINDDNLFPVKDTRMDKIQNDSVNEPTLVSSNIPQKLPKTSGKTLYRSTECSECGRVLSNASALENHMRLHTGERPYTCSQCGKAFPSVRGLNRHLKVHAEEKRYQCEECGKSFVYHFTLTKHQLIHSGERPFPCKVCGKRFLAKADRSTHMRMHTGEKPFSCAQCGKKFKHRVALNMHMQGHRGEKRYVCPICEKGFVDLGNFKRHKLIHTGERPFECKECGKRFTQSAHLKKHVNTQHVT
ncbi:pogo transposable element with ZNF domain isoform X1 [Triplophysa rosa]|uniref:Transcription factor Sp4-like n=1 Tax=Triplophysa rosa TaxID=992332 RepID=A0A9W8C8Z7_TRIRA|nr:pogo transposable element with ZNF domain isoform X1 [Triplophysa rosa]KAI7810809.1 putative transcription factor Sp4-like [Triplophysa rosa]